MYPIEWRRQAFFLVMDQFLNNPQETTRDLGVVKVLQYLIIPSIQYALERWGLFCYRNPVQYARSTFLPLRPTVLHYNVQTIGNKNVLKTDFVMI